MKINLKFLPTFFLASLLLLLLIEVFWPINFLEKAKRNAAAWPQLAKSHLHFSQALFKANYQDLAERELALAKKSLINQATTKELFEKTEKQIKKPKEIQTEIESLEEILEAKPGYRDVFLNLALLYDQQYRQEKSKEYFEKAFYLDPLNERVQEIGKVLGFL